MVQDRPRKPARASGQWPALALAIAVHVVFIAVLVFSLRWQNRKPEPVTAELYAPATKTASTEPVETKPPPAPEPPPAPPPPAPSPEPTPAPPPKPAPKAEPKVERPPDTRAADIAARKSKEDEDRRRREQAEREKREAEQREADKKNLAEQREAEKKKQVEQQRRVAEARERRTREAEALKAQAEREQTTRVAQQKAEADAAVTARAEADYIRRIQAKIKGNVVLPPELPGNPEAIFEVVQLPTGEIIDAVLKKSSGVRAYDDAVQRAILKSSPLPRPDRPELFQRTLTLKFRPLD